MTAGALSAELSTVARRAVEAATGAGASDAEAYVSRECGRQVRVHGGEVESLTAATQTGVGIRAWGGRRVGYAYGTDLSEAGVAAIAARAAEAAAVADEDEFAAPPAPAEVEALAGLSDPSIAEWETPRVVELALAVERTALDFRSAPGRGRGRRLRRLRRAGGDRLLGRGRRRVRVLQLLRLPSALAEGRERVRPALASASPAARAASTRRRSAPRGRSGRWR